MSHCKAGSIKTDASWKDIWHIMLEWVRQRAPLKNPPKKLSPGLAIMAKTNAHGLTSVGDPKKPDGMASNSAQEVPDAQTTDEDITMGEAVSEKQTVYSYLGADFDVNLDDNLGRDADRGKYVRYQLAPRENWGPMSRAK
jgi:tRNA (guanine26-N2/guanine27-N2)-dimethyltransferase